MTMERKLATLRRIEEIQLIEGADKIVKARIGGWWVVTAITNGFSVGDLVIYLEIDSWVPDSVAPFLTKPGHHPKEYNGVPGQKLRTVRLRGQLSQGLIMPLTTPFVKSPEPGTVLKEGDDVTEYFNIQKWEAPVAPNMQGQVKGSFPSFISKTNEERAQNLVKEIFEEFKDEEFEVSVKLDGSSMTVYYIKELTGDYTVGVCSRNLELKIEDDSTNTYIDVAKSTGLLDALQKFDMNIAIQGELMGPGIQGNREGLSSHEFYCYKIWDIDGQCYLDPANRAMTVRQLKDLGANISHVPVLHERVSLYNLYVKNIDDLLAYADGPSLNNPVREGLVFKSHDRDFSFKVISNKYLLKQE